MSLLAAALLAGCVSISVPREGAKVSSPGHVQAVVGTPSQNPDGSWTVKTGDKPTRAELRIDGTLKEIFPGNGASSITIDRRYPLPAGVHKVTITGFERDGDSTQDSRHFSVGAPTKIKRVVWIWFENHGYDQVRGVGEFKRLADTYGEATNFFAYTHPSQPNYIYATAGQSCGITTNALSTCSAENIFHQVGDSHWRSYQESMPANCDRTTTGPSPVKHDPARTFTNIDCAANDVPLPARPKFNRKFTFVTPNMCNSAHDCSIETASDFLASFTPKVLNSPQYKTGKLLFVVTFDEDEGSEGNHIYTTLVHEKARGKKVDTRYTFCNLLATTEDLLQVGRTGCAADAESMQGPFGL
ncbi:MAG: alkaline phosphatase family protein [Actinomycetota bacterium]